MEHDGPGTPTYLCNWLLDELEARFPSTIAELLDSSLPVQVRYIQKIDAMLTKIKDTPNVGP